VALVAVSVPPKKMTCSLCLAVTWAKKPFATKDFPQSGQVAFGGVPTASMWKALMICFSLEWKFPVGCWSNFAREYTSFFFVERYGWVF
jgi:hypothetical protein